MYSHAITPAQAIDATLGSGTLTAEQVRELIAPHLDARPTFDFGHHGAVWRADFQTIADKLNATLGSGTCENKAKGGEYTQELTGDSREKLEADVRKHYAYSTTTLMYPPSANKTTDMLRALPVDTVIGWLDRQAAITQHEITERWAEHLHPIERECGDLRRKVEELTAECDELQRHCKNQRKELADLNNVVNVHRIVHEDGQVDVYSVRDLCRRNDELTAERDNFKANNEQLHALVGEQAAKIDELQSALDAICANLSIIATVEPSVIADIAIETIDALIDECNTANRQCNEYRSKFGKCLDYADAIHALMDDEGLA